MPLQFIQPSSPVTAKSVPAGEDWLHEPKLDGYRLQVIKEGRQVGSTAARGHEWSKRLAALAEALHGIPAHAAVVDAALCFPGTDGAPDFFPPAQSRFPQSGGASSRSMPSTCRT